MNARLRVYVSKWRAVFFADCLPITGPSMLFVNDCTQKENKNEEENCSASLYQSVYAIGRNCQRRFHRGYLAATSCSGVRKLQHERRILLRRMHLPQRRCGALL